MYTTKQDETESCSFNYMIYRQMSCQQYKRRFLMNRKDNRTVIVVTVIVVVASSLTLHA